MSCISNCQDSGNLLQENTGVKQVISRKFMSSKTPYTSTKDRICLFAQIKNLVEKIRSYLVSISRLNKTACFLEMHPIDLLVSMDVK